MKTLFCIVLTVLFCACSSVQVKETPKVDCDEAVKITKEFFKRGKESSSNKNITKVAVEITDVKCIDGFSFTGTGLFDLEYMDTKNFKEPQKICSKISVGLNVGYPVYFASGRVPTTLDYGSIQVLKMDKCEQEK